MSILGSILEVVSGPGGINFRSDFLMFFWEAFFQNFVHIGVDFGVILEGF